MRNRNEFDLTIIQIIKYHNLSDLVSCSRGHSPFDNHSFSKFSNTTFTPTSCRALGAIFLGFQSVNYIWMNWITAMPLNTAKENTKTIKS